MRLLVSGASGFIGRKVCGALLSEGNTVRALSRDPDRVKEQLTELESAFAWEATAGPPPAESMQSVDAVIHLSGEQVAGRWNRARKAAIRETRVKGTRHLVDAMLGVDPKPGVLIAASAMGYYGSRGDEELTEKSGPGQDFLAGVCQEWEAEALRAVDHGVRVVLLRIGLVLGTDGGALREMLTMYRRGLGGRLGSGRQWWPWVHHADVVGLLLHALSHNDLTGPLNVGSPNPVRQKAFAKALGRAVRRPAILPAPGFALRALLGGFATELLSSKRMLPTRALETGYTFRFTELGDALDDLLVRT